MLSVVLLMLNSLDLNEQKRACNLTTMFCFRLLNYICCSSCTNQVESTFEEQEPETVSRENSQRDLELKVHANSIVKKIIKDLEMKDEFKTTDEVRTKELLVEEDVTYESAARSILQAVFANVAFELVDVSDQPAVNM